MKTVKSLVPYVLLVGLLYVAYTMFTSSSEGFAMDVSGDIVSAGPWMSDHVVSAAVKSLNTYTDTLVKVQADYDATAAPMKVLIDAWRALRNSTDKAVTGAKGYHEKVVAAQKAMDSYSDNIQKKKKKAVDDTLNLIKKADSDLNKAVANAIDAKKKADKAAADKITADANKDALTKALEKGDASLCPTTCAKGKGKRGCEKHWAEVKGLCFPDSSFKNRTELKAGEESKGKCKPCV
jgi:hypothetical protein